MRVETPFGIAEPGDFRLDDDLTEHEEDSRANKATMAALILVPLACAIVVAAVIINIVSVKNSYDKAVASIHTFNTSAASVQSALRDSSAVDYFRSLPSNERERDASSNIVSTIVYVEKQQQPIMSEMLSVQAATEQLAPIYSLCDAIEMFHNQKNDHIIGAIDDACSTMANDAMAMMDAITVSNNKGSGVGKFLGGFLVSHPIADVRQNS